MLIAPIFHNNYLTTKQQSESQNKNVSLTPNNHTKTDSNDNSTAAATTSSRYNIFKTALNRGTELIRNTFLSKTSNYSDSIESNSSPSTSVATTTTRNSGKIEFNNDENSLSSNSNSSSSSSPDSIKNELMYFKPINRELQTPSCSTKIIRIPSIRSTSSSSTVVMHSPCPSPFFIPVSSQRQSAFSFVFQTTVPKSNNDIDIDKPRAIKRKQSKMSDEKHILKIQKMSSVTCYNKTKNEDKRSKKKTEDSRKTRSMKRLNNQELIKSIKQKEFKSPSKISSMVHREKYHAAEAHVAADENEFRRITRSMKN